MTSHENNSKDDFAQQWNWNMFWFGLISLSNGILTFVGHLMPKPSLQKNSTDTI